LPGIIIKALPEKQPEREAEMAAGKERRGNPDFRQPK
jgi:hypothetical protein